jgi:hypothetical protein
MTTTISTPVSFHKYRTLGSAGVSPAGLAAIGTAEKLPARRRRYKNSSLLNTKAGL